MTLKDTFRNLPQVGVRGIQIHQEGDCGENKARRAGKKHFAPTDARHGPPPPTKGPRRVKSIDPDADPSRLAALLVGCVERLRALLAPWQPVASTPLSDDLTIRGL